MKIEIKSKIRIKDVQLFVPNLHTTSAWDLINTARRELNIVKPQFLTIERFCEFYNIKISDFSK
ncbi:MAG: hypothetical protein LBS50_08660 [Prevotellaceae bacterium]|jgi:hypothetical protein|nr:hypothetical protein [Prevotellaceae bacterium]